MESLTGKLLVVDDIEANRDMLSRRLARRGYTVDTAVDGRDALDQIESESFDVIILDIMMPGIDGIEVLKRLRETRSPSELPIIMATAKDESEDIVGALKLGANDYVTKPFDFAVVLARIQTQILLRRAHEKLSAAHARMKRDLDAAARVQQSLLPEKAPPSRRVRFAWSYQPCDELGGDSLNIFEIDEGQFGIYLLDVSGHGVPASLLSVTVTHSLAFDRHRPSLLIDSEDGANDPSALSPAFIASRLNDLYPMEKNGSHYFTLVFGILDAFTGRFRFVAAGHPGPALIRSNEPARFVDVPAFPIGIVPGADFDEGEIILQPGDRLYLHSDGLMEEMNAEGEQFGRERLGDVFTGSLDESLDASIETAIREVADWCNLDHVTDDISVVALEMLDPDGDADD